MSIRKSLSLILTVLSVEVPGGDDMAPVKAYILPLFAVMTAEQQARIFLPPPEGHRLIVVATNVGICIELMTA